MEIQGIKEKEGKLDYSEINLDFIDLMAKRFNENKHKYPRGNSKNPIDKIDLVWAIFRHTRKILKPVKGDPETIEDHLAAIGCNVSMVKDQLELENNPLVDKTFTITKQLVDQYSNDIELGKKIRELVK